MITDQVWPLLGLAQWADQSAITATVAHRRPVARHTAVEKRSPRSFAGERAQRYTRASERLGFAVPRRCTRSDAAGPATRADGTKTSAARSSSEDGGVAVLQGFAREAVRHYDIRPRRITLAAVSFNSVFRIAADTGTYALRVGAALRIHTPGTLATEAAWQRRLRDGGMAVPDVRANTSGSLATDVSVDGLDSRACTLFDWVAGRSLRTRLTRTTAAALGRLAALLHRDAEAWLQPRPDVLVADRVLYWRLPDRLTGPDLGFGSVFGDALERAQTIVENLWRHPPQDAHLVHGDLAPANVIATRGGGLVPIDFQDLVWGFDMQDLAITVAAFRRAPDGQRLAEAFHEGYTTLRPWPEMSPALLESLVVARLLNQINLTLNLHDAASLADYLAVRAERLRGWLRSPSGV
jgi:Ser/Thr protein kinase RdoA (MazF antagonist)